jgi:hypothetical protein
MSISHSFCEGGDQRKVDLSSLRKIQLLIPILALVQFSVGTVTVKWAMHYFTLVDTHIPLLKLSKWLSVPLTDTAVARHSLQNPPVRILKRKSKGSLTVKLISMLRH